MISLYSYFLTFLGVLFWIFRVVATLMYQLEIEFFATPLNTNMEIAVLFATLPCLIFVVKRNIVGAAAYLGLYVAYFGTALYEAFLAAQATGFNLINSTNMFCVLLGVVIPILTFLDILLNKNRTVGNGNTKADWFYKNEQYDRQHDEREDRNQYRM